jgi:CubicO group peptidase (beta-lactamase class C family)
VEAPPGERWKYSGGGYQIIQQLIEDATSEPFAEVVEKHVIKPAGMSDSGYATPATGTFAKGHGPGGLPLEGGWHDYPEQAAAGLWTTPTDLARFGLSLSSAFLGRDIGLLPRSAAVTMLTPVLGGYGLGPGVQGGGDALTISHGGANEGFRAFWVIHPNSGDGVAVMTNGDGGDRLIMEIIRSVSASYGWSDFTPEAATSFQLADGVLRAREGVWFTEFQGHRIQFNSKLTTGGGLNIETPRGSSVFTPISPTIMRSAETGDTATFVPDDSGKQTLNVFGFSLTRCNTSNC